MIFLIIFVFCKLSEASLFKNAMVNSNSSDSEPSKYHSFSLGMLSDFDKPLFEYKLF